MIKIRPAAERGHANQGWLDSWHTFSFASYYDPAHMGFRCLRVLNDDRVAPARGFGAHAHRDMEIITYVLDGQLSHRDSTGQSEIISPNTIQVMSAGTGVVHSEFNPSPDKPVHLLQIWIEPAIEDAEPSYQQMSFDASSKQGRLKMIAGPHPAPDEPSAVIHQDARVYAAELKPDQSLPAALGDGRFGYIQVARGVVSINGQPLREGDGAALESESRLVFTGESPDGGEFLFFDLP